MSRVTLAEQIMELERELAMRARVYPNWISSGKLSKALADRQIECMEGVLATLKWLAKHETTVKAAIAAKERKQ